MHRAPSFHGKMNLDAILKGPEPDRKGGPPNATTPV